MLPIMEIPNLYDFSKVSFLEFGICVLEFICFL